MDEIDHLLLGARREAQAFRVGLLRRPPRACYVGLRASDTRLVEDWNVLVDAVVGVECFDVHRSKLRRSTPEPAKQNPPDPAS